MAWRGREMKGRKGDEGGVNDGGLVGRWSRSWREEWRGKRRKKERGGRGGGGIALVR